MGFLHISQIELAGISACVPKQIIENRDYIGFTFEEAEKFMASTGVERRRIASNDICTSDLCYHAAERLIKDLQWSKDDIDCLILVTQTPDYYLPATSYILQSRLGLKEGLLAFDLSLGCSGWVYGVQVLGSLLSHGQLRKGLLLVGDTPLKGCSIEDKSTFPLFGDAGTATAIVYNKDSQGISFNTSCDGTGYETIIIPEGAYRKQVSSESFTMQQIEAGIKRNGLQVALDGMNVFSFGISKAPESIKLLSEEYLIDLNMIDYFLFHQANFYMNEKIRKKLGIPPDKVPYSLKDFGNTSSATIPLTMITQIKDELRTGSKDLIACGFGVGLSWGSMSFRTDTIICSDLVEI